MFLLGYEITIGILLLKKKNSYENLWKSPSWICVAITVSSFQNPWLGLFDLFLPVFCPLNQSANNTVAVVSAGGVKNDAKQPCRLKVITFLLFSSGLQQLWSFICLTGRNKVGFGEKQRWWEELIRLETHLSHIGQSSPQFWPGFCPTRTTSSQSGVESSAQRNRLMRFFAFSLELLLNQNPKTLWPRSSYFLILVCLNLNY